MMIFDSFPSLRKAHEFAETVTLTFGLDVTVFNDVEQAQKQDLFPYPLVVPIVHVARASESVERRVTALVSHFGGEYAGT